MILWLTLILLSGAEGTDHSKGSLDLWRTPNRCGSNVVFAFAELHNIHLEYDKLVKGLQPNGEQANLGEMRDYLIANNLRTIVVKGNIDFIKTASLPVILHLEGDQFGGFEYENRGHFIVVVDHDDRGILALDGTTGMLEEISWTNLRRDWSGYALISSENETGPLIILLYSSLFLTIVILSILLYRPLKINQDRR